MELVIRERIPSQQRGLALGQSVNDLNRISIYSYRGAGHSTIIGVINQSGVIIVDAAVAEEIINFNAITNGSVDNFMRGKFGVNYSGLVNKSEANFAGNPSAHAQSKRDAYYQH